MSEHFKIYPHITNPCDLLLKARSVNNDEVEVGWNSAGVVVHFFLKKIGRRPISHSIGKHHRAAWLDNLLGHYVAPYKCTLGQNQNTAGNTIVCKLRCYNSKPSLQAKPNCLRDLRQ